MVLVMVCLVQSLSLYSQDRCGHSMIEEEAAKRIPDYDLKKAELERQIQQTIQHPSLQVRNQIYIPVVVHVVYNGIYQKISEAQVRSQIELLNADFSALLMPKGIPEEFADRFEDVGIRFCLAKSDPDGSPTSGITYHSTAVNNIGIKTNELGQKRVHHTNLGGADAWPTDRYLNVWVCHMEEYLGFATSPGSTFFSDEDGVVINFTNFGNMGTVDPKGKYGQGKTTTHEVGHYFSLLHLWGKNANGCGDDLVEDTPDQSLPHYGCPNYPQLSCFTSNMYMNYMDYVDDACMFMFTPGQGKRMRATLENSRKSLLNSENTQCEQFNNPNGALSDRLKLQNTVATEELILTQDGGYNEVLNIRIYDASGREVSKMIKISQQKVSIQLERQLQMGMYFMDVRTKNDHAAFKFLITN